jgi:penicillin-binding protein 2
MKNKNGRIVLAFVVLIAFAILYEVRLFRWQISDYTSDSSKNSSLTGVNVTLNAARGEIYDKNGNALAVNRTTYNVVMNALKMEDDRNPAILSTIRILDENGVKWTDKLPIGIDEAGSYYFIQGKDTEIENLKSANMLNMQSYATADECMNALIEKYDCASYSKKDARDIISVRYNMTKQQFSTSSPYVIANDVPIDVIQIISEISDSLPGIETKVSTVRDYGDGTTAPHIIGTTGSISQEQYDNLLSEGKTYSDSNIGGYTYADQIGQDGIESAFESDLRGTNGQETVNVDSNGNITSTTVNTEPVDGNSVYLTIDANLQRVANQALKDNIDADPTTDCTAGAAVVLDVKTFGVLACATYPTYDLTKYTTDDNYYYNLMQDETNPLFNRALNGIFTPGSTIKPMVATAALEEGVIDDTSTVTCTGKYTFYEDYQPTCMEVHGTVNVFQALQRSCNVFFYDVGRRLTIEKMGVYAKLFALGEKTGVEIPETKGIMSSPTEYNENNNGAKWTDGLTVQAAIGQADDMFTPIEMATYCATIANNGVRLKTHFLDKIVDYDGGKVIKEYQPEVVSDPGISAKTLSIVKEGMAEVCEPTGTAYSTFGSYGIKIAAKTGTAQNSNHSDNTLFICYAPYDDPQIAVAVVLEYGASGKYSQAVAKAILDQYFYGSAASDTSSSESSSVSSQQVSSQNSSQSSQSSQTASQSQTDSSTASINESSTVTSRGADIPDAPAADITINKNDETPG